MTRHLPALPALVLLFGLGVVGCTAKPSEELCQRAVENIRKLTGQTHTEVGADPKRVVRSCRAQSKAETVECMAEAPTAEKLFACGGELAEELMKAAKKKDAKAPEPSTQPSKSGGGGGGGGGGHGGDGSGGGGHGGDGGGGGGGGHGGDGSGGGSGGHGSGTGGGGGGGHGGDGSGGDKKPEAPTAPDSQTP